MITPHGQGQHHFIGLNDLSYLICADEVKVWVYSVRLFVLTDRFQRSKTIAFAPSSSSAMAEQLVTFGSDEAWMEVMYLCASMRLAMHMNIVG